MKKELTEEQINELLEMKRKYEKVKEQRRRYTKRRLAKVSILLKKAAEAGITVTDEEIDEYLSKKNGKGVKVRKNKQK